MEKLGNLPHQTINVPKKDKLRIHFFKRKHRKENITKTHGSQSIDQSNIVLVTSDEVEPSTSEATASSSTSMGPASHLSYVLYIQVTFHKLGGLCKKLNIQFVSEFVS